MKIEEYEPPIAGDYAPRKKASQIVAAAHRAGDTEPITPLAPARAPATRNYVPLAIGAGALVLAMLIMMTWQLNRPMKPLVLAPTSSPAPAPTSSPAPAPTSSPAPAPTSSPAPAPAPTSAPAGELAPAGRGLTLDSTDSAGEVAPAGEDLPTPSTDYIQNVGAQAPHSPRGGLCGPTSGDCAPGVPAGIDNNQYIANVGAQAPHKVR